MVSWRLFPTDTKNTAFDLYRTVDGVETKVNTTPIQGVTNYHDTKANLKKENTYRLTYAGKNETIGTYTISQERVSSGLPYISIPLTSTTDVHTCYKYEANDASVGDVDGDGVTYYRKRFGSWSYIGDGPEFISVLDGTTGKELARAPYINRDTSESWGDSSWKRSCSYRVAAANVSGETLAC